MQIKPDTFLHIVSKDGATKQTLREFVCACQGGMDPAEEGMQVFTEKEEANAALTIRSKRRQLNEITDEELLNARVIRVIGTAIGGSTVEEHEYRRSLIREIVLTERRAI